MTAVETIAIYYPLVGLPWRVLGLAIMVTVALILFIIRLRKHP